MFERVLQTRRTSYAMCDHKRTWDSLDPLDPQDADFSLLSLISGSVQPASDSSADSSGNSSGSPLSEHTNVTSETSEDVSRKRPRLSCSPSSSVNELHLSPPSTHIAQNHVLPSDKIPKINPIEIPNTGELANSRETFETPSSSAPNAETTPLEIPSAIVHSVQSSVPEPSTDIEPTREETIGSCQDGLRASPGKSYSNQRNKVHPICAPLKLVAHNSTGFANLQVLSQELSPTKSPSIDQKQGPLSQPEVWADGRQELCEALPYFRAYHGGGYSTEGYVRGFMFDKCAHPRDYVDSYVVISRAGGGMVKSKDSGELSLGGDQGESSQVRSLRNNMRYFNPVVIITGADNPKMPTKPPHTYCVLDYFKPCQIWSEKSQGKTFVRYRFEKLNANKTSWWGTGESLSLGSLPPPFEMECPTCGETSQQVYIQGWMCLQSKCESFWMLEDDIEPIEEDLSYDPRFLRQKTAWPNDNQVYALAPSTVELSGLGIPGEDSAAALWAGAVCPECGRCNSRLSWMGWECGNPICNYTKLPPKVLVPATSLREPFFPLSTSYTLSRDLHLPIVGLDVQFQHNYRINKYTIPGIDGFVAHMIANQSVIEEGRGPNAMFEELQQKDIGLRRRSLGAGMLKGESHTRHFLVNYGMPYKFIAATASESFEGAAGAITDTRTRLNWASKWMVQDAHQEFNEVLALGYFEEQKINYHDDGEFGLGTTIATLSLGAPGTMRLRMKARHYNGVSKEGVYNDAPPIPGCNQYAERLVALTELTKLKASVSGKDYRARLKTISKELKLKSGGQAKDAITMTLGHGDIVIMHGAGIQKYYEHAVDHGGKLRFALTCRYIDPGSLKPEDRPKYEVGPDLGAYDGTRYG